jgi:uncharacterized membrane protein
MPREETRPAPAPGPQDAAPGLQDAETSPQLSDQEQAIVDILMAAGTPRTPAQLAAASGLSRSTVASALDSLRERGLVVRYNTLVESYGARFPGVELQ